MKRLIPAIFAVVLALPAFAQKNELALTAGGFFPTSAADFHAAPVIEGSFAHRVYSVPMAALYVELPVTKTFDAHIDTFTTAVFPPRPTSTSYSGLFVTPGLKLKLAPSFPISPWLALGGGVAHFSKNGQNVANTSNSGVVDFGAGADMKVAPFISLRGQVRDYYSSGLKSTSSRQHNIIVSGGLVLRF